MNFWFDRNVPFKLTAILNAYDSDNRILHQDDDARFEAKTPDEVWMRVLADDDLNWVAGDQ